MVSQFITLGDKYSIDLDRFVSAEIIDVIKSDILLIL